MNNLELGDKGNYKNQPMIRDKTSLGTLLRIWVVFQVTQTHPFPYPTNNIGCMYPEFFQLCIGWGRGRGGRTARKFHLINEGTKKLQEVMNIALLSQGYRLQNFNLNLILTCNKYKQY